SDTLVLKLSEDAYKGDAQYTISVDGKQVGGTLTAHASHAAGQSDTITVNGDWAAGDHKVSLYFLNDAYDGTAATDRNLYLDSATYNGAAVSGGHLALMSAGAQGLTVHDTSAIPASHWLLA
ncbi:carbohydrate-binding domain-containing protein, partial [Methylobacterium sp. J-076]|uniref:carbohydrate-binding domain-containing protein n=1 Tax=Methylobacterium sp. J-076 TaxID=2836655 RepID=UPI002444F8EC